MVLVTKDSAGGKYTLYEGTNQEVIDALDAVKPARYLDFGHNGTTYFALVRKGT